MKHMCRNCSWYYSKNWTGGLNFKIYKWNYNNYNIWENLTSLVSLLRVASCKGFMQPTRRIHSCHKSAVIFNVRLSNTIVNLRKGNKFSTQTCILRGTVSVQTGYSVTSRLKTKPKPDAHSNEPFHKFIHDTQRAVKISWRTPPDSVRSRADW